MKKIIFVSIIIIIGCNRSEPDLPIEKSWEYIFSGPDWGTFYDIHFSDEKNGILIGDFSTDGGYCKTKDGGLSWEFKSGDIYSLYILSFSDRDTGIVITTYGGGYTTTDGGQSFFDNNWEIPIEGNLRSGDYSMINSKEIIMIGYRGAIAKSVDGGQSWETYSGFTFQNHLNSVTCTDNITCFACGETGKVIKTSDGGLTWQEQEVLINNDLNTIYFIDNNYGFAGGQYGALIRTTDGGNHWDIISTGLNSSIIEIYFADNNVGYIVSSTGEIRKTDDGGNNWKMLSDEDNGVSRLNKAYFKDNIIFGLQSNSIYKYNLGDE